MPPSNFKQSSTLTNGLRRGEEELTQFRDDYLDQKREYETIARDLNKLSLRKAAVTSMRVLRASHGAHTSAYIDMNLEILEDKELVRDVFGPDPLTVRILRNFVGDSRGGSWQHLVEFMKAPSHRVSRSASFASPTVLMSGTFPQLRLFHAFDLVRIVSAEFKRNHLARQTTRQEFPSDDDFALVVAGILHRFSLDWRIEQSFTLSTMFPYAHPPTLEDMNMSALFFDRWCDQPDPQRFSLEDFSTWNDGVQRTIRAIPKDDRPLFWFREGEGSFRRKLSRQVELQKAAILEYSVGDFCDYILHHDDPAEGYSTIRGITRYKMPNGLKHEFVVLLVRGAEFDFYLRIDRSALQDLNGPRQASKSSSMSSSSVFPSDDKVRVALSEEELLKGSSANMEHAAQYGPNAKRFNLRELAKILMIFRKESPDYIFLTENCYFLASLLQEVLTLYTQSGPSGGRTWVAMIPGKKFGNIIMQYQAIRSVSSFDEEVEAIPTSLAEVYRDPETNMSAIVLASEFGQSDTNHSSKSRDSSLLNRTASWGVRVFGFRRRKDSSNALDGDLTQEPEEFYPEDEQHHENYPMQSRSFRPTPVKKRTLTGLKDIFSTKRSTKDSGGTERVSRSRRGSQA